MVKPGQYNPRLTLLCLNRPEFTEIPRMLEILLPMAAVIACGVAWRSLRPAGVDADQVRRVLTQVVWNLMLPALVLAVLWKASLGNTTFAIAFVAASVIVLGLVVSWVVCRACRRQREVTGALMLAAAFPNATYLGLPVLEKTLGPWARSVAIQYDLFACTPMLLIVGVAVAQRFGHKQGDTTVIRELVRVPPLWAALLAVVLNVTGVVPPKFVENTLSLLGSSVVPLMLFSVGLGLRWEKAILHSLPAVAPVAAIRLLLMPLAAVGLTQIVGLGGDLQMAVVMEAAMPTMLIGMVICDRYGLNSTIFAAAVTLTTLLSLVTLPLWFELLNRPSLLGL
jgi:predicted permease